MNEQARTIVEHNHAHFCGMKCLSWTAIFAGVFVAIGLSFLLNLLCLGIGASALSADETGATVLVVSGFVGLVVSIFVSMFFGGFVAGSLGRPYCPRRNKGELYGFITWTITLIVSIFLAAHVTKFVANFTDTMVMHSNTTIVDVNAESSAPLVSKTTSTNPVTGDSTTHNTVNVGKATNAISMTVFVTFFLFFIGALASCFGGRVGMHCKKRCTTDNTNCPACK